MDQPSLFPHGPEQEPRLPRPDVERIRQETIEAARQAVKLTIVPITFREAFAFVQEHHRHLDPPQGCKFVLGLSDGEKLVGVAIVGRPVSRSQDDGLTAEVTRLATLGNPNACSMLYGAARRIAREMGYVRIITYTLQQESGASLKASGWVCLGETKGGNWSTPSRRRRDRHPTTPKVRWECLLIPGTGKA